MPQVDKFISHAPAAASFNLIYNGKVLDIQLDSIAFTGSNEAGYSSLVNSVKEGDPGEQIADTSPIYEYKPFFKHCTVLDLPSGTLVIYNLVRIVIPVILRPQMLSLLHRFHLAKGHSGHSSTFSVVAWNKLTLEIQIFELHNLYAIKKNKNPEHLNL